MRGATDPNNRASDFGDDLLALTRVFGVIATPQRRQRRGFHGVVAQEVQIFLFATDHKELMVKSVAAHAPV